jgi:tetratricopeptide (TPR) repeat protein
LVDIYCHQQEYDTCIELLNEGLEGNTAAQGDLYGQDHILCKLGEIYTHQENYKEAIGAFHRALGLNPSLASAQRSMDRVEKLMRGLDPNETGDEIVEDSCDLLNRKRMEKRFSSLLVHPTLYRRLRPFFRLRPSSSSNWNMALNSLRVACLPSTDSDLRKCAMGPCKSLLTIPRERRSTASNSFSLKLAPDNLRVQRFSSSSRKALARSCN